MSRIDDELEQAVRDAEAASSGSVAGMPEGSAAGVGPARVAERSVAAYPGSRAGGVDVAPPVVTDAENKRGWGLLVALLALGGGVLALVLSGGDEAVVYSYQVDELKAKAAELGERQVRVQGTLVYGTLVKRDNPCEHRFKVRNLGEKAGEALEVHYPQCVVPDTFREVKGVDVEVTAEGRLAPDGTLQASKIFAKCPSKYEMRESADQMGGQKPQHVGGPASSEYKARAEAEGVR